MAEDLSVRSGWITIEPNELLHYKDDEGELTYSLLIKPDGIYELGYWGCGFRGRDGGGIWTEKHFHLFPSVRESGQYSKEELKEVLTDLDILANLEKIIEF